jgi:MoaA/NifB/PqqE/SkfB family radical SAM enzyme/spore coat polysaccharide biosynthesis protein SpsF (cytidylyltransferase family)
MKNVTAILSMLHELAERNSATRLFRQNPVLSWTMDRLSQSKRLDSIVILCWEDQVDQVLPIAKEGHANVLVKGPRHTIPSLEAVAAAQKFADGWRGGLQSTCEFDRGFHAPWMYEIAQEIESDAVLLIDPASGLVDYQILDATIEHAEAHEDGEMFFTQAAPGLSGALLRASLLERLAKAGTHPGRILHYMPEHPARDPIGGEGCVAVPTPVARTTRRFKLDSQRQIDRISAAAISLNGTLVSSSAQELLNRLEAHRDPDLLPRDVTIELMAQRDTKPIFMPAPPSRPDLSVEDAERIFTELATYDDTRITFAGVGDPLLHDGFLDIIAAAQEAGIHAIHVETDLLVCPEKIEQLVDCGVDVVSVHLPAMTPATYAKIMGVDRLSDAIENIKRFVTHRQIRRRGVPLLVPTFVKLADNLAEMELWYDQWLKALGSAVIVGPSDFAGQIATVELADMRPPKRSACRRLESRLTILSDGAIVACEQDVFGKHALGHVGVDSIQDIWRERIGAMRADHASGNWSQHVLCGPCREWHRP